MLLRIGVIAMICSVAIAAGVAALVVINGRPVPRPISAEPAEALVATSAPQPEPQAEPLIGRTERHVKQKSSPEPKPEKRTEPQTQSQSGSEAKPAPKPEPGSEPRSSPAPQPVSAASDSGWPVPRADEIAAVQEHRNYSLVPGAIMSLTIDAIGLHKVPVMDSDSTSALDQGVVHIPETSLPWSQTPQRNVYIAGHRLGYPGTGSRLIFYELDKLTTGDEIVLRDREGRAYHYRVSEIFRVDPNDSWVMGQVRGRDMVTLQTCTGPGWSQRLIVRADRVAS